MPNSLFTLRLLWKRSSRSRTVAAYSQVAGVTDHSNEPTASRRRFALLSVHRTETATEGRYTASIEPLAAPLGRGRHRLL